MVESRPATSAGTTLIEEADPVSDQVRTAPGVTMPRVHRKALGALTQNLAPDEAVHVVVVGAGDQAVFGTARRAFVFKKGFLAGASFGAEVTTWDYRHLVGVQLHTGMMTGAVVLQASGQSGKRTSYWGNQDDDPYKAPNAIPVVRPFPPVARAVAELRRLVDAVHAGGSGGSAAAPPSGLVADELRKLADLRAAGLLSDEEFDRAKSRLLAG